MGLQPRRDRRRALAAMLVAGAFGLGFERVIVRPVYGQHLKQILVTLGGAIVGEELIKVVWGPAQIPLPPPEALRGSIVIGDATVDKLRLVSVAIGLVVLAVAPLDAQPHQDRPPHPRRRPGPRDGRKPRLPDPAPLRRRVRRRLGARRPRRVPLGNEPADRHAADRRPGQRAALHRHHHRRPRLDARLLVGALLVGLVANYIGFLAPKLGMFSSIGLMVAVLMWRPQGLYPVVNR
jgi:branched-chain amino acid transport system permease protein